TNRASASDFPHWQLLLFQPADRRSLHLVTGRRSVAWSRAVRLAHISLNSQLSTLNSPLPPLAATAHGPAFLRHPGYLTDPILFHVPPADSVALSTHSGLSMAGPLPQP